MADIINVEDWPEGHLIKNNNDDNNLCMVEYKEWW